VLGPCPLLRHRCNSTPASSTEKNCPLQIKEVTLSQLAGGRTAVSGKMRRWDACWEGGRGTHSATSKDRGTHSTRRTADLRGTEQHAGLLPYGTLQAVLPGRAKGIQKL